MSDITSRPIDDMEGAFGGAFKRARAELGVTSFGMAIVDLPPDFGDYPAHDHLHDGQEEVYVTLRGGGSLEIEGVEHPLDPDRVVRVGPDTKRKLASGPEGIRLLIVGGVPGQAFEPNDFSELGADDDSVRHQPGSD
jgi:mannose-6-phosphate isomerase-like protein (cupin superfamily)